MSNKRRVNIPISRFLPNLALECAIFLHLPRNQRFVKLIEEGDSFDASQLNRLTKSGISHLLVNWDPAKGDDPDAYQLFRKEDTCTSGPATMGPAISGASLAAGPSIGDQPTEAPQQLLGISDQERDTENEAQALNADDSEIESPSAITAEAPAPEVEQSFSADSSEGNAERRLSGGADPSEEEQRFGASPRETETQHRITAGDDNDAEAKRRFSSTPNLTDTTEFRAGPGEREPSERLSLRASANAAEEVRKFSQDASEEDDSEYAVKADETSKVEEELAVARLSGSREFPTTLSRLAARLGHSLGYQNTNYLADLGITAVYHFARKAGHTVNDAGAPELTKCTLSTEPSSPATTAVTDAQDVLRFLDAYVAQPDCDHSDKEFSPKLVQRVMGKLGTSNDGAIDAWNLQKWSNVLNAGETIDAHSVCSKASAKAIKYVKANFEEESLPH